jgi:hypothetical protein
MVRFITLPLKMFSAINSKIREDLAENKKCRCFRSNGIYLFIKLKDQPVPLIVKFELDVGTGCILRTGTGA